MTRKLLTSPPKGEYKCMVKIKHITTTLVEYGDKCTGPWADSLASGRLARQPIDVN